MGTRTIDTPHVQRETRQQFLRTLDIGPQTGTDRFTLSDLQPGVEVGREETLAAMGEAIREDLSGQLDATLLAGGLAASRDGIERLPELRAEGIPPREGGLYREVSNAIWPVYEHLDAIGFFESIEAHLPAFTSEHINATANELIRSDPLTSALSTAGFSDREQTAVVVNVVTNDDRLALWTPTRDIPDGVEFDVEHVPPLHQRAAGGALLWIDDLDGHLWQNEILVTDELLDRGVWDVKAMLGGFYLMTAAAHDITEQETFTDSQLTAALTASAAIMINGQDAIVSDLYRITDDMRAPRREGT